MVHPCILTPTIKSGLACSNSYSYGCGLIVIEHKTESLKVMLSKPGFVLHKIVLFILFIKMSDL